MEQMEVRHCLTFEFSGLDDKFVYVVSEDTKNSVQQELLNRSWELQGSVIEFREISGRKIAINALYLCRCRRSSTLEYSPQKARTKAELG